jgi:hypothetical protein
VPPILGSKHDVEFKGQPRTAALAAAIAARLLRQSTTQGRTVLQRVLCGRLTFTPREDGAGYDFSGPSRFDRLFTGIASPRPSFIANDATGTEDIEASDTSDADYGPLLEQVYAKGVSSPPGTGGTLPALRVRFSSEIEVRRIA